MVEMLVVMELRRVGMSIEVVVGRMMFDLRRIEDAIM